MKLEWSRTHIYKKVLVEWVVRNGPNSYLNVDTYPMIYRSNWSITRDTNQISTHFFLCVKNMSRCVKYQEPGEGFSVGFWHSCHVVKMPRRQKQLGFLEYTRGPPHNVQTDTSLVSDHTYQWGSSVSNDVFNLTNSPSPTRAPELQYTRDGTCEYAHSRCTC